MINLLFNEEKEKIKKERILKIVIIWEIYLILFFLFLFFFLLLSHFFLSFMLDKEKIIRSEKEKIFQLSRLAAIKKEEEELKVLFPKIIDFSQKKEKNNMVDILISVFEQKPEGVFLKAISIDDKNILIEGFALNREGFLAFKDRLEKEPFVESLNFPIDLLLKKENVDFGINVSIKK